MPDNRPLKRRDFLRHTAAGGLALYPALLRAAELHGGHPLAPKRAHFEPKAQHLIVIFLTGGMSHVDTFDYKPKLKTDQGKVVTAPNLRETARQPLMASPFAFRPCGQSGLMVSEL